MQKCKKSFIFLLTIVLSFLFVACGETDAPRSPITVVSDHGAVSVDKEFPARWDSVTATIAPEEGYMIEKVTLNGVNYTTKLKNNKLTFDFTEEAYTIVVTYSPLPTLESAIDFKVEIESGREARVLQLTDPQLIDSSQMRTSNRLGNSSIIRWAPNRFEEEYRGYIRQTIEKTDPDLIIITGDLVYGEFDDNGSLFREFCSFMESFEIPWAPIFGNHDNESKMGVDWQCEQLTNAEHCLFKQRTLTGNGNYTVGIMQDGKPIRAFFMMDSNGCANMSAQSKNNGHSSTQVGLAADQIEWMTLYANTVRVNAPACKLSLAMHIQPEVVLDAFEKYGFNGFDTTEKPVDIDNHPEKAESDFGYLGANLKTPWDTSYTFFDKMKTSGFDSLFFGHEHCNSASAVYEGIRFTYGLKSSTYDRANYRLPNGSIVISSDERGTPLVGGTFFRLGADGGIGDIRNVYCL